jgi:hypothetical protein
MRCAVALRLARVSLLPTVVTNALAGTALAGGRWDDPRMPLLIVALALFYTGGMFLNDAFDREFDARVRPDRPIPVGDASAAEVFTIGFGLLAGGLGLLAATARLHPADGPWNAAWGGLALAAAIVAYDAFHKSNPLSPFVMGLCRMLVYVTAALAVAGEAAPAVLTGATVLLGYLIGVTYAAKKEHLNRLDHAWPLVFLAAPIGYGATLVPAHPLVLMPLAACAAWIVIAVRRLVRRGPGDVPRAVVGLLAGISLVDAIVLAGRDQTLPMLVALVALPLTLRLQRWVSGT